MFRREDLKSGMMVLDNKGNLGIITTNKYDDLIYVTKNSKFMCIKDFRDDLTCDGGEGVTINKVYSRSNMNLNALKFNTYTRDLLWERKEEVVLTMQEIADKFGIDVENLKIKK